MGTTQKFVRSLAGKDTAWLRQEVSKRDGQIRTLKFDLGFGKVGALKELRVAKRERAQLLTVLSNQMSK